MEPINITKSTHFIENNKSPWFIENNDKSPQYIENNKSPRLIDHNKSPRLGKKDKSPRLEKNDNISKKSSNGIINSTYKNTNYTKFSNDLYIDICNACLSRGYKIVNCKICDSICSCYRCVYCHRLICIACNTVTYGWIWPKEKLGLGYPYFKDSIYNNSDYNDSVKKKLSNDHLDKDRNTVYVSYKWCRKCLVVLTVTKCPLCNKESFLCSDFSGCGTLYCSYCQEEISCKCFKCNKIYDTHELSFENGKLCCKYCINIVTFKKIGLLGS